MEPSTRQRIRDYLLKYQSATTGELGRGLGMTRANIQYHLQSMLADQIVEIARHDDKKHKKRGRPTYAYQLTSVCQPNNLNHLLVSLLQQYLDRADSQSETINKLKPLADLMFPKYDSSPAPTISIKLNQAVEQLNHHHYLAHWEAHQEGPRLIIRNCPYRGIRQEIPETCLLDQLILHNLLDYEIVHLTRMEPVQTTLSVCTFALLEK